MGLETRIFRTIGASVVLAALVVIGAAQVGNGQDTAPAEVNAPETTTTAEPEADSTTSTLPPEPFTYRVGLLAGVSTDNFWAFYGAEPSVWNSYVLGPTKPALFTASTSLGVLEPELTLDHAEPIEDGEGWAVEIHLDDRYHWSDGTPVTASDVVFTFDTVRQLALGGSWAAAFPETLADIVAEGDHRLRISFTERPQLGVWPHGVGTAPIMPAHVWGDDVAAGITAEELYSLSAEHDVGGGPLALSRAADNLIVSVRNDGHPSSQTPDVVEYHVYADEESAITALGDDEIDYVLTPKGMADHHVEDLGDQPGIELITSPGNNLRYLGFNLTRAPMSEPVFRTALALLLDRNQLAASISDSLTPATAMIPTANSQWFDEEAARANADRHGGEVADRLGKAISMLGETGYAWETAPALGADGELVSGTGLTKDGAPLPPLTILTPGDAYDPARVEYAKAIADSLAILGFDARPVETDFDTVVDLAFTPDEEGEFHYDMYLLGWSLGNPALPGYYGAFFAADGVMNNTGYASEAFEEAHDAYLGATTVDQARAALWEMEAILTADLPYLPLYSSEMVEVFRSDRVTFAGEAGLGGIQARLGGIRDVNPTG